MTDATGPSAKPAAKPRKTAAPKSGFAAVDREAQILESAAVQGDATPTDVGTSSQGDVSSPSAARRAGAQTAGRTEGTLSEEDSVALAALELAQGRARAVRDWALIRREEAKDAVRTHPLGSSALVFGAGMIFGLLLARR